MDPHQLSLNENKCDAGSFFGGEAVTLQHWNQQSLMITLTVHEWTNFIDIPFCSVNDGQASSASVPRVSVHIEMEQHGIPKFRSVCKMYPILVSNQRAMLLALKRELLACFKNWKCGGGGGRY